MQHMLPAEVVRQLDFSTLTLVPGSFIDEALRARYTDLMFSVQGVGGPALVFLLFEHMSSLERWMALRLLGYMVDAWKAVVRERPESLPVIIPAVLHHGGEAWDAPTEFAGLFDPNMPASLGVFVPRFCYSLDDLTRVDDEALRGRALSAVSRLALSALKHARTAEELLPFVPAWTALVRDVLREANGVRALELVFRYLSKVRGRREIPELEAIAAPAVQEANMQTIADFYEERGEQRGEQRGLQRGLLAGERIVLVRLLRRRFGEVPAAALARIEAAEAATLERWSEQVLDARTLEEALAD